MKSYLIALCLLGSGVSLFGEESSLPSKNHLEKISELISPRNVQILIQKDASEALLEIKGPYYIYNPQDGSRVADGLLGKRFMVHELESGLKWGEHFAGIHQIYIKPRSQNSAIFINGIQYEGAVAIYGVAGRVHIINDVNIESYVKSILSTDVNASLDAEVLSALAILARTDAYYHVMKNKESFWHLTAQDVGFQGNALVIENSPIEKAVNTTKHLILVHPENGKNLPFATAWTEHSAGRTAAYETIFRKDAFSMEKGVQAPHAALAREESKWSYRISKKNLAKAFGLTGIDSIESFVDPDSKKVYGVRVKDKEETFDIDFLTFQTKLGKENILSSDFSLKILDGSVDFQGFGKGHGVGLCLYSASALAQNGEDAIKILSRFFPHTYLYNLNALPEKR